MSDSALTSFRSVIDLWRSREAMAVDVGVKNSSVVRKWWMRDTIPSDWWMRVLETETAKSAGLSAELFARFAAKHIVETRA